MINGVVTEVVKCDWDTNLIEYIHDDSINGYRRILNVFSMLSDLVYGESKRDLLWAQISLLYVVLRRNDPNYCSINDESIEFVQNIIRQIKEQFTEFMHCFGSA
jgi:hypothetical protein